MIDKKQLLRVMLKLMSLSGLCFLGYMFFAGLLMDGDDAPSYLLIDVVDIGPGEIKRYSTDVGELLILHRTDQMLQELVSDKKDAYAFDASQNLAENMHPVFRSRQKRLFVAYAMDPFYRCAVDYDGMSFKSVCVDVKYNLAGRVYKSSHAQGNLIVPDYQLLPSGKLQISIK